MPLGYVGVKQRGSSVTAGRWRWLQGGAVRGLTGGCRRESWGSRGRGQGVGVGKKRRGLSPARQLWGLVGVNRC